MLVRKHACGAGNPEADFDGAERRGGGLVSGGLGDAAGGLPGQVSPGCAWAEGGGGAGSSACPSAGVSGCLGWSMCITADSLAPPRKPVEAPHGLVSSRDATISCAGFGCFFPRVYVALCLPWWERGVSATDYCFQQLHMVTEHLRMAT